MCRLVEHRTTQVLTGLVLPSPCNTQVYEHLTMYVVLSACRQPQFRGGVRRAGGITQAQVVMHVQVSAVVACRALGFNSGVFQDMQSVPAGVKLAPPWLSRIPCTRVVDTLLDCGPFEFGGSAECGLTQRLVCTAGPGARTSTVQHHVQITHVHTGLCSDLHARLYKHVSKAGQRCRRRGVHCTPS